jgi:hypothetical protein
MEFEQGKFKGFKQVDATSAALRAVGKKDKNEPEMLETDGPFVNLFNSLPNEDARGGAKKGTLKKGAGKPGNTTRSAAKESSSKKAVTKKNGVKKGTGKSGTAKSGTKSKRR